MVSPLNRKLLRDIWRLKGQVIAIAFVVACGIATYIMSHTAISSLAQAKSSYYDRYRIADVYSAAKRAPLRLAAQIADIEGVAKAYPRVRFMVSLDVEGMDEPARATIISVPEVGDIPLNDLYLVKGRYVAPSESGHVMVSEAFAKAHGFKPGDGFKAVINGRQKPLTISGIVMSPEFVYSLAPGSIFPDDKRYGILFMGRRALEAATNMDGAFNDLAVKLVPGADEDVVMEQIDNILAPYGGIDAYPKDDNPSYWFVENELTQLNTIGWIVPAIFLSVAAFLLNIVLSRQISTERDQIGMLKAIGYYNLDVGLHYLGFAVTIVLLGGVLGTFMGMWFGSWLLKIYTLYFHFPVLNYVFDPNTLIFSGLICVTAAVVGTLNAVRRVVKLPPAEAMQPAPPMVYRKTLLERMKIHHLFSTTGKMIFRHLERRPSRALLSIVGVSMSAAIFLASTFVIDSVDYMLDVQFQVSDRASVDMSFVEARSSTALEEAAHLPGVMAVEGYRQVPARIVFEHKSHRGAVTGVVEDAQLKRMVDVDIKPVSIPDKGIMLSEKLAQMIGAGRGDNIKLEVLVGRRPVVEVRVVGLVQEYVGANAFMNLNALNALMGDGKVVSGVSLLTNRGEYQALYSRVKDMPMVNTTITKTVLVNSVRETMTQGIIETFIVNSLFAGLIAFGVIYNTARISLSERARELGSLRVLGFTQREVSFVLLGELVLLVLIAIPLGIWIGMSMGYGLVAGMDTELFRIPVVFSSRTIGATVLITLIAASISCYVVWRRIIKLDIVKVLKTRE